MSHRTQTDIVNEDLLYSDVGQEVTETMTSQMVEKLHLGTPEEIISRLTMILKIKRNVTQFKWTVYGDWDKDEVKQIRHFNLKLLATKPRKEIAEALMNTLYTTENGAGICWRPGEDYFELLINKSEKDEEHYSTVEFKFIYGY